MPSFVNAQISRTGLVKYDATQRAIVAAVAVDEVKDIRDKALASYARQATDETLHRYADRIKARAIRQCEKLLKRVEAKRGGDRKSKGGHPPIDSRKATANGAGLSSHQAKQALRVAAVPEESFERQVESDRPPTITQLAEQGKTPRQREFERLRADSTAVQYHAAAAPGRPKLAPHHILRKSDVIAVTAGAAHGGV